MLKCWLYSSSNINSLVIALIFSTNDSSLVEIFDKAVSNPSSSILVLYLFHRFFKSKSLTLSNVLFNFFANFDIPGIFIAIESPVPIINLGKFILDK